MKKRLFPLTTGGGGGGSQAVLIEKEITENGEYRAESEQADGFSVVNVAVPEPVLTTKSITTNGTYAASSDSADGFSSVTVNVATPQPTLISKSITENGSYSASADSADGFSSVSVAVPANFEKYHIVATTVNDVVNLAITDYTNQATDNYYIGTVVENGVQNLYILTESGQPMTTAKALFDVTKNMGGSNTSAVGSFTNGLFSQNANLTSSDLAKALHYVDTENVENFRFAFYQCTGLTSIPLIDVRKGRFFSGMCYGCRNLTSIPNFEFGNVSLTQTFYSCSSLVSIPDLDLSNVTGLMQTFASCTSLQSISFTKPIIQLLATDTNAMYRTFYNCTSLQSVNIKFTNPAVGLSETFSGCSSLTTIQPFPISGTFNSTFNGCSSLVIFPAFDFDNVTQLNNTFAGCSSLEEFHATNIKVNLNLSASDNFDETALNEIIDNLVDVGASRTLTIGATNLAKLTQADIDVATNKGWTLA